MKTIGERLIELREKSGLSKVEMAEKLGVNKSSITRYETNEIKPNLDMMLKIAELFNVTLDWLVGFEDNKALEIKKLPYMSLINECIENDISPEQLRKAVNFLNELKG